MINITDMKIEGQNMKIKWNKKKDVTLQLNLVLDNVT